MQLIITVVVTSFRCAVAVPHRPDSTADHRDSTVVRIWWSMSLFAVSFPRRRAEADSMVQTVRRTFFFPSVHGGHVPVVQVVLAIPVVVNDRCARLRLCRKLLKSRSYCSSSSSTIPCCGAEVDPHGPRYHGDSTVAVLFLVVDVPVGRLCRFFVAVCVKTVEFPQLRLVLLIRRMLGSTADTSSCVTTVAGFAGDFAPRAVLSSSWAGP